MTGSWRQSCGRLGRLPHDLEFLPPLTGPPVERGGRVTVTTEVQAGVTAQRLRYLDLLFEAPWHVSLAGFPGVRQERQPITVQVPHPGFFMVQKLLITGARTAEDRRAKDMAYFYQVASLFRRELPVLAAEVRAHMEGTAGWRRWLGRVRRQGKALFSSPDAPGVRVAHRLLSAELAGQGAEVPSMTMIHAGIRVFLDEL